MNSTNKPYAGGAGDWVDARGYLALNWGEFDRAPFVLNPDARQGDLLAWCWAEVVSLLAAADVVVESVEQQINISEFAPLFVHRLRPLEAILSHVITGMAAAQQQQSAELASGLSVEG